VLNRSPFRLRFIGRVDRRLKPEVLAFARWLRRWYSYPSALELRLVHEPRLIDTDGTRCALRWWQNGTGRPVVAEIAVHSFARNLCAEGPKVAYPTVIAAMGRVLKYYDHAIIDRAPREASVERWGDKLLDAYVGGKVPPAASKSRQGCSEQPPVDHLPNYVFKRTAQPRHS
jgi:hypothetical protein